MYQFFGNNHELLLAGAATSIVLLSVYIQYVHRKRRILTDEYLQRVPTPTTIEEAFEITQKFSYQDFPFLSNKALEFGLFKTYGIPSIAQVLSGTGQLTHETNRRYDDTDILVREFTEHSPHSKRSQAAIQRMNHIHSQYKISNRDYLYVLSVFIVEPIVWAEKFGYRDVSPKEKVAFHLLWKFVAEKMNIQHIFSSYDEALIYMKRYEQKYMKYSESNKILANATTRLFLSPIPMKALHQRILHPFVYALCTPLLRVAMGFPRHVNPTFQNFVENFLHLHSFIVKHLVVPKSAAVTRTSLSEEEYEATIIQGGEGVKKREHSDMTKKLFTLFDPYGCTYRHGYRIEELGPIHLCPMAKKKTCT